jgi:dTDP-glucose 4,6-dehydratase
MKILVTGCKGTVGTPLVKELRERGHHVFGIDLMHAPGEHGYTTVMSEEDHNYCRCDIREYRQLLRLFEHYEFDFVYNCAAEFGRWNGEDYYEKVWETNCIGLKHLLILSHLYAFKLLHFSSAEVYGDYPNVIFENTMEEVEIKQMNDYAISKWANEMQILNWQIMHPTSEITRVRLFDTYGPGEIYHPYRGVIAKFAHHALHRIPVTLWSGHTRCGVYIDDMIDGLANICENFHKGRVYNLASQVPYTIMDVAQLIWKYAEADWGLVNVVEDHEILTTVTKIADSSLARKEIGFKTDTPLAVGLKKTVEWMREYYGLPQNSNSNQLLH